MDRKIKILKGRAKSFDLFIEDEKGNPKSIAGWSIIRLKIPTDSGFITKYAPLDPGVNEVQQIDLKLADAGNFRLKFGDEITTELSFNSTAASIQSALNGMNELSGVLVTDIGGGKFDITFTGDDGSRAQPLLEFSNVTLSASGSLVTPTATETTAGKAESGIDVVEEACGHLKVKLATENVAELLPINDQDIDLYVRIGKEDLDLDPELFKAVLDVEDYC